ncbi:hypothetical protein RchiOBHm_Chr2g0090221 [Rosa chinensis]|uniref:Uncharacterized protein n=2 Tax=Rosa chinensis TaxID=74649 RepID=A0A2P6RJG0_ROSCH|nr:hypothetical protein RchiOBHm_Chr2g0090221 [Rosa chinensis]
MQESQEQAIQEHADNHVFCFDVAQPHIGWRKLSSCFVTKNGTIIARTPFHGRALTLDLDNLKLVFTYAFDENAIQLFLMFYFEEKVVELGKLSIEHLPPEFTEPTEYSFIHLRDHTVCLILSRFTRSRGRENDHYTVYEPGTQKIVLVPFTFTCLDDWWWIFSFQFMSTKVLEYQTKEDCDKHPEVLGCFVL